jgi:PleD family two-component response regulator
MAIFEPMPTASASASAMSSETATTTATTTAESKYDILEEGKSDVVFITYFKNMLDSLKIIRKMSELYNTDALLKSHQNLWDGMKSVQFFL